MPEISCHSIADKRQNRDVYRTRWAFPLAHRSRSAGTSCSGLPTWQSFTKAGVGPPEIQGRIEGGRLGCKTTANGRKSDRGLDGEGYAPPGYFDQVRKDSSNLLGFPDNGDEFHFGSAFRKESPRHFTSEFIDYIRLQAEHMVQPQIVAVGSYKPCRQVAGYSTSQTDASTQDKVGCPGQRIALLGCVVVSSRSS